jgi:hypothetical protein
MWKRIVIAWLIMVMAVTASQPFTVVTNTIAVTNVPTDLQELAIWTELYTNWVEREVAMNTNGHICRIVMPTNGVDIQGNTNFWFDDWYGATSNIYNFQTWIASNCQMFMDTNFVNTITNYPVSFYTFGTPYMISWNTTNLYKAAGLTNTLGSNGFRRCYNIVSNKALFAHGFMQPGDIWGYWLIEDLQKAMTCLRYTERHGQPTNAAMKQVTVNTNAPLADAIAYFESEWSGGTWIDWESYSDFGGNYGAYALRTELGPDSFEFSDIRQRGQSVIGSIPTMNSHSAKAYFPSWDFAGLSNSLTYTNLDAAYFNQYVPRTNQMFRFWLWQSFAGAKSGTRTTDMIGDITESPDSFLPDGTASNTEFGIKAAAMIDDNFALFQSLFILDWNFSNCNN